MKSLSQTNFRMAVIFVCAFAFSPTSAKADLQTIRNSDSGIWGSVGTSFLNYKESVTPIPDSEHGWLPSIAAGVDYMWDSNWYVAVEGAETFGDGHYNGATFFPPSAPLQGTTGETISTIDGKVGKGFALNDNTMLIPYVELGFRVWNRDLGGGEMEDYYNFDSLGGLMLQIAPTDRLVLSAYGSAGTTFAAHMQSDGNTYDLGSTVPYKIGGKIGYDLTKRVEIFTTLDYDHFRYGQSPVLYDSVLATYASEPGSGTNETTVRVGIGYHFN